MNPDYMPVNSWRDLFDYDHDMDNKYEKYILENYDLSSEDLWGSSQYKKSLTPEPLLEKEVGVKLSVGDLVQCNCEGDVWYRGLVGTLVWFDSMNDPHVMYGNGEVIRLAGRNLEVIK